MDTPKRYLPGPITSLSGPVENVPTEQDVFIQSLMTTATGHILPAVKFAHAESVNCESSAEPPRKSILSRLWEFRFRGTTIE